MKISVEQQYAVDGLLKFSKKIQVLSGFAGTGKSFLINYLVHNHLPNFSVCSYTGKAAHMLRRKGVLNASTIHSLIYLPLLENGKMKLDKNGNPIFVLNPFPMFEGIIIDEASMVSKEIYEDLCSFNVPLIFVGDHGQLEPIGETINLMKKPDYCLETIHRNA